MLQNIITCARLMIQTRRLIIKLDDVENGGFIIEDIQPTCAFRVEDAQHEFSLCVIDGTRKHPLLCILDGVDTQALGVHISPN